MTQAKSRNPNPGKFLKILGACYLLGAGFGLMMSYLQVLMLHHFPSPEAAAQANLAEALHGIWRVHLTLGMAIGTLYLVFGFRLPRMGRRKFLVSWVLLGLTAFVALHYVVAILPWIEVFARTMPNPSIRKLSFVFGAMGAIVCLLLATVPQIWIHFQMKKQES